MRLTPYFLLAFGKTHLHKYILLPLKMRSLATSHDDAMTAKEFTYRSNAVCRSRRSSQLSYTTLSALNCKRIVGSPQFDINQYLASKK